MSLWKWIYQLNPGAFNKIAFEELPKEDEFGKMQFAFVCEGKRYYRYIDALDIPIARKAAIDEILIELSMKTQTAELSLFLDAIKSVVEAGQKNGGKCDLNKVMRIVGELEDRREMLVHIDIWFALVGATHYAEGEKVWEWNAGYEAKKVESFKREYSTGGALYDFFVRAALNQFIPYIEQLEGSWIEAKAASEMMQAKQRELLNLIISQPK